LPESDGKIKFILNVSRYFWKMEEEQSDSCPKKYLSAIFVLTKKKLQYPSPNASSGKSRV
jgi:hypothetical protein